MKTALLLTFLLASVVVTTMGQLYMFGLHQKLDNGLEKAAAAGLEKRETEKRDIAEVLVGYKKLESSSDQARK